MTDNKKIWEQRLKELEEEEENNIFLQNYLQSLSYVSLGYFQIRRNNDSFQINMSNGITPKLRKQPPY